MAVKIKLKRMGKIREPYYRIVVADARTKRDGRAIEEIGKYHPKADPSFIEVNSERAQHWLSVGAQPTDPVRKLLEVTGDWQRFKGLPGAEGTLRMAAPRSDKKDAFAAALAETLQDSGATTKGKGRPGGKASDAKAGDAKSGDAKSGDAKGERASRAKTDKAEKPATAEKPEKPEKPRASQGRYRQGGDRQGGDRQGGDRQGGERQGGDRRGRDARRLRARRLRARRLRPPRPTTRRQRPRRTARRLRPSQRAPRRRPPRATTRLLRASRRRPRPSRAAETDVLIEALEHLVRGIVDYPDDVNVSSRNLRRGRVLQVRVHPEDLGKVIGRGGRTARALRTVIGSLAGDSYVRVDLLDADEAR